MIRKSNCKVLNGDLYVTGDNVDKENECKEIQNQTLDKNIKHMLHWIYFYFFRIVIKAELKN